jgi:hypothetical protein
VLRSTIRRCGLRKAEDAARKECGKARLPTPIRSFVVGHAAGPALSPKRLEERFPQGDAGARRQEQSAGELISAAPSPDYGDLGRARHLRKLGALRDACSPDHPDSFRVRRSSWSRIAFTNHHCGEEALLASLGRPKTGDEGQRRLVNATGGCLPRCGKQPTLRITSSVYTGIGNGTSGHLAVSPGYARQTAH